ncbi:MAG: hypothetical protein HOP19_29235 [Acidobacteria bacterium]|nr:hypothetical protein [Acidobacteriota bacterium]
MSKEKKSQRDDHFELKKSAPAFGENTTEWLLSQALQNMHATEGQGRQNYRRAIAALKERAEELPSVLKRIDERLSIGSHAIEWGVCYVLAEVEDIKLLPHFVSVALRKVPERNVDQRTCERPEDLAVLVQVMAVEAIERLIRLDKEQATKALIEIVKVQDFLAVRRVAIQAVIGVDPTQVAKVRKLLPDYQRWLLDVKRVPVEYLNAPIHPSEFRPRPNRPGVAPKLKEDRTSPISCTNRKKEN